MSQTNNSNYHHLLAISPLIFFLVIYVVTSIWIQDFYKVPISAAFLLSSLWALLTLRKMSIHKRLTIFSKGASNHNILLMIWIFILAGTFAQSAKTMGAIDATVQLALHILPDKLIYAGIFLTACFISLSIGTSVGTIVALTPMAAGIAQETQINLPFMVAIVVGGAFFGDNLSFISDTTIAATKTQGCKMSDKFRVNSLIVLPAALLVLVFYIWSGSDLHFSLQKSTIEWIKIFPYLLVLILALCGINVLYVLTIGIIVTGITGFISHSFDYFEWLKTLGDGITGMGELIIITLLAGGMLEVIRYNGGIDYIIRLLTKHINSKRGGEFAIAFLVSLANVCTANNTIAVITIGPIAKDISRKMNIDNRKSASILDTFSCFIQGIIPYGAQLLMASGLAGISPIAIISYLYYPFLMGLIAFIAILCRYPAKYS